MGPSCPPRSLGAGPAWRKPPADNRPKLRPQRWCRPCGWHRPDRSAGTRKRIQGAEHTKRRHGCGQRRHRAAAAGSGLPLAVGRPRHPLARQRIPGRHPCRTLRRRAAVGCRAIVEGTVLAVHAIPVDCGCQPTLRCVGPDSRVRCSLPWDAGPRWTWAAPRSTAQRTCWWPPRDYGRAIRCWRPDGGRRARRAPLMRRSPPCCIRRAPSGDGDVAGRRGTWPCCVPAAASTVGTGSGMVGRNVGARVAPRSRHPNAAPPGRAAEVLPADRRPAAAVRSPASPLRAMDQTWGWRTVP